MHHLYNKTDTELIIKRLEKIKPNSKRQWGTMSVTQMLVHLNLSLEPAMGLKFPKRKVLGRVLSPILKRIYLSDKPMVKNSPTNDTYIASGDYDFEKAKKEAIEMLVKFYENGPDKCTTHPHPYLGKLTPKQWAVLKWKHYDHHLRQFGE